MEEYLEAIKDQNTQTHQVNLVVELTNTKGTKRIDYREDPAILREIGNRAKVTLSAPPVLELITVTSASISYNIRAVHHRRGSTPPSGLASIAAIPGAIEIIRSQLQNINRVAIGVTPGVGTLIKPDPLIGHSPVLDIAWESLGTLASSSVTLIVHCTLTATGADTPDYV